MSTDKVKKAKVTSPLIDIPKGLVNPLGQEIGEGAISNYGGEQGVTEKQAAIKAENETRNNFASGKKRDIEEVFKPYYDAIDKRSSFSIPNPKFKCVEHKIGLMPPTQEEKVTSSGIIIPEFIKTNVGESLSVFPLLVVSMSKAVLNDPSREFEIGDYVYVSKNLKDTADKYCVQMGFDGSEIVLLVCDSVMVTGLATDHLEIWKEYARLKMDALMGVYRMNPKDKREKALEALMPSITRICLDGDATTRYVNK